MIPDGTEEIRVAGSGTVKTGCYTVCFQNSCTVNLDLLFEPIETRNFRSVLILRKKDIKKP